MDYYNTIENAATYIKEKSGKSAKIGLILGSGLGELADRIENPVCIPYSEIPGFAVSTVAGHAGQLVLGTLSGKEVVAMQGRQHFYEGWSMAEVVFPVRVMKLLGVSTLVVTNACGTLTPDLEPGMFMFIRDHLNLMGTNPLIGPNDERLGPRFPDLSKAYDKKLILLGREIAAELKIRTGVGVYAAVSGPYYCAEAELIMIRRCGGDTIGMSTVPEVIAAAHCGLRVLGISCITDKAIPGELEGVSHEIVMEAAAKAKPHFIRLVSTILERMD